MEYKLIPIRIYIHIYNCISPGYLWFYNEQRELFSLPSFNQISDKLLHIVIW